MISYYCRKGVPNSPRIITSGQPGPGQTLAPSITTNGTSPKGASGLIGGRSGPALPVGPQVIPASSRPLLQYSGAGDYAIHQAPPVPQQQPPPPINVNPVQAAVATTATAVNQQALPMHEALRRYIVNGTCKFFGVNSQESNEKVWMERRRRLAIKLFGGVKDDFHLDGNGGAGGACSIGGQGGQASGGGGASGSGPFEDSLVSWSMMRLQQKRLTTKQNIDRVL